MRSIAFAAALLLGLPALAAGEQAERLCAIKLTSTYRLVAPAGWKFVHCSAEPRDENRNFTLEPLDPALRPGGGDQPPVVTMYGGAVGRGTVEATLASDREKHANAGFVPNDADGLRTADKRDVRVLQLTKRGEPYTWFAHGFLKVGPVVFWLAFECKQEDQCAAHYAAFQSLVGGLQVLRPNEFSDR